MATRNNSTDGSEISPESRLVAERYEILDRAETRLWREMHAMFNSAASELEETGFLAGVSVEEEHHRGMIQVSKPNWPKPFQNGIHFEVWADRANMVRHRGMMLFLDIEDATEDKDAVIDFLWRILMPYEAAGLLQKVTGCKMRSQKNWRFFEEVLPLRHSLCSRDLSNALEKLASISWAIDQALFVKGGKPVWRTDFLPQQQRPRLQWGENTGGQEFTVKGGLLGGTCVRINGTVNGNHDETDGQPTHIMTLETTNAIRNGEEIYLSCVLRTDRPGRLWFIGDGYCEMSDGTRTWPPLLEAPYWQEIPVERKEGWQHIGRRFRVRNPPDYDFSKQGVGLMLRAQTGDPNFSIGCIEIGRS